MEFLWAFYGFLWVHGHHEEEMVIMKKDFSDSVFYWLVPWGYRLVILRMI